MDNDNGRRAEMKYRKKPVVIEAVQLRWDTWSEMCDHAGVGKLEDGKPSGCYVDKDGNGSDEFTVDAKMGLWIPTLEGLMLGVEDDWIIKGVKGELYPCKPDIFEQTYEIVEGEGVLQSVPALSVSGLVLAKDEDWNGESCYVGGKSMFEILTPFYGQTVTITVSVEGVSE